jgi:hypothetical protein
MSSPITTVELFDESFVFSSSEDLSNAIGAVYSQNVGIPGGTLSLLSFFGDTADNEAGYILLNTVSEWINRYTAKYAGICGSATVRSPDPTETSAGCGSGAGSNCFNGATGTMATHWWSVHNFLQYGGKCIIAGDTTGFTLGNTVLVDKSKFLDVDVVFALDNTQTQANSVYEIVKARNNDCFGVVGASGTVSGGYGEPINGVGGQSAGAIQPRGVSLGQYGMSVFGEKEHFGLLDEDLSLVTSPLIADVAGCLIRTDRDYYPWFSPAGYVRGRILNILRLKNQPSEASQVNLLDKSVNFATTVSGQGTFLFSDKTLYPDSTSPYRYVNVSRLLIYLIKNITPIAKRYLFEFNNSITRTSFTNSVTPILEQAKSTGGLIDYTITCDESNNTDAVISANNFVADIKIKPAKAINYITLRFTNLNV